MSDPTPVGSRALRSALYFRFGEALHKADALGSDSPDAWVLRHEARALRAALDHMRDATAVGPSPMVLRDDILGDWEDGYTPVYAPCSWLRAEDGGVLDYALDSAAAGGDVVVYYGDPDTPEDSRVACELRSQASAQQVGYDLARATGAYVQCVLSLDAVTRQCTTRFLVQSGRVTLVPVWDRRVSPDVAEWAAGKWAESVEQGAEDAQ